LANFLSKAWNNLGDVEYANSTNEFLDDYVERNRLSPDNIPTGSGDTGDGLFNFLKEYKKFGV
tara:strand:+ start:95 stop:283 length:189 start_codon:yes stop_codon:yes gene_type:complete